MPFSVFEGLFSGFDGELIGFDAELPELFIELLELLGELIGFCGDIENGSSDSLAICTFRSAETKPGAARSNARIKQVVINFFIRIKHRASSEMGQELCEWR